MSTATSIQTEFTTQTLSLILKTFSTLGWEIKQNVAPRSYYKQKAEALVAINPDANGYDVGIREENGKIAFYYDKDNMSVNNRLGKNFELLKQGMCRTALQEIDPMAQFTQNADGSFDAEIDVVTSENRGRGYYKISAAGNLQQETVKGVGGHCVMHTAILESILGASKAGMTHETVDMTEVTNDVTLQ